jgi:hypothetical protein
MSQKPIIYTHNNTSIPTGFKYFFEFTSLDTKFRHIDSVVLDKPYPSTLEVYRKAFGATHLDAVIILKIQFKVIPICFPQY